MIYNDDTCAYRANDKRIIFLGEYLRGHSEHTAQVPEEHVGEVAIAYRQQAFAILASEMP
jgi:hypothetical protein